ncbi:MAG: hypothetical protein NTW25_06520 [Candidatus Kapabacteria bacterium]|nr:hypothetical protein [Candidatus Kapabacteria bacterium]
MKPKLSEWHIYGNEQQGRFTVRKPDAEPLYYLDVLTSDVTNKNFFRILDKKQYELKDHLGNVRVAIGDMKIPTAVRGVAPFVVDEKAVNDYYPYGMLICDRSWSSGSSRYGYNGKENDNELKGTGNSLDFGERVFDPRIIRFPTPDKLKDKFAFQSSYVYAGDSPINSIDKDGKSKHTVFMWKVEEQSNGTFQVVEHPKCFSGPNGYRPIYDDHKYLGPNSDVNSYEYKGKPYSSLFDIPGKPGEYFKDQQSRGNDLILLSITAPITFTAIVATATVATPVATTILAIDFVYNLFSTSQNAINRNQPASPTSIAPLIGRTIGNKIDEKFGTENAGNIGEIIGNILNLRKDIKEIREAPLMLQKVNSTISAINNVNETKNSIEIPLIPKVKPKK